MNNISVSENDGGRDSHYPEGGQEFGRYQLLQGLVPIRGSQSNPGVLLEGKACIADITSSMVMGSSSQALSKGESLGMDIV